jgi:hypothetical protein
MSTANPSRAGVPTNRLAARTEVRGGRGRNWGDRLGRWAYRIAATAGPGRWPLLVGRAGQKRGRVLRHRQRPHVHGSQYYSAYAR